MDKPQATLPTMSTFTTETHQAVRSVLPTGQRGQADDDNGGDAAVGTQRE